MNGCSPPRLLGVRPTTTQVLPGCRMVVGETAAEARDKRALLDNVGHLAAASPRSRSLNHNASVFGLPRPENRFFSKPKG